MTVLKTAPKTLDPQQPPVPGSFQTEVKAGDLGTESTEGLLGLGLRVEGGGLRVKGWASGFRLQGLRFWGVWDLCFKTVSSQRRPLAQHGKNTFNRALGG